MINPHRVPGRRERSPDLRLKAEAINQRLRTFPPEPPTRQRSPTAVVVANALASAIEQARTRARLTQDEVALKLNLDRSAITRWENGERIPTILHLIAFSELAHVSLVDLLRPVEAALRPDAVPTPQEDNDAADD
jgi:ribosome-binding protein aMBF1 (putative translation factor)